MTEGFSLSRSRVPAGLFMGLDIGLSLLTVNLAAWLRFGSIELSYAYQSLGVIHAFLVLGCSLLFGVYQSWRGRSLWELLGWVFLSWAMSFILLVAFLVMTKSTENYSRLWLGTWMICAASLTMTARAGVAWLLRYFRLHGRNSKRVLIVGNGRNFQSIIQEMGGSNEWGFNLDTRLKYTDIKELLPLLEAQLERDDRFHECWLCLPLKDSGVIGDIMHLMRNHTMEIRYMPGLRDMPLLNHRVTPIGGFYSLDLSCSPMADINASIKRLEDIVLASCILVLISPVLLAVATAVKLTSEGPVLFRQKRLGANGQVIKVFKFRSMVVHQEQGGAVTQAVKNDTRLTPIGAFLRRTSLDELPQFFNVLAGGMSIVGPRPHALAHNEQYMDLVDSYMKRHKVKPGITGLAQVNGYRGETDTLDKMQKRVEMDLKYINSWSVLLDLKIIFLTVFKGFSDPNAY